MKVQPSSFFFKGIRCYMALSVSLCVWRQRINQVDEIDLIVGKKKLRAVSHPIDYATYISTLCFHFHFYIDFIYLMSLFFLISRSVFKLNENMKTNIKNMN